ncbi:MAG: hypothetical protein N2448_02775 [Caloramator sp.]|nr:hypothetical protein [Caloramator sp.]
MNIIDLREYNYELNKIISFSKNELIFGNTEFEEGCYKRYFYKYNIQKRTLDKINLKGIDTCENAFYNARIINGYIFTNIYEVKGNHVETLIYSINVSNGKVEKLYNTLKEVKVIILNDRYALFQGDNYGIDDNHLDIEKDMRGEYNYATLCDFVNRKEYTIKDKRVVLGIRDFFIPFEINDKTYIVFEEAYMEDWEIEEAFEKGIKKEDFYNDGYKESMNIISLEQFEKSIKKDLSIIPFTQIHKTEYTEWTRYFGMDYKNIYFRVKNFESKIENIYSIDKNTLNKELISSIQWKNKSANYKIYDIYYDEKNKKIYEIKGVNDKEKIIEEVFDGDLIFKIDSVKENFVGVIGENIITYFWTEDENGDNYREFVRIRNIKTESIETYEGICSIINENLILFK